MTGAAPHGEAGDVGFTSGGTSWCEAWAAHRRIIVTSEHGGKEKKSEKASESGNQRGVTTPK